MFLEMYLQGIFSFMHREQASHSTPSNQDDRVRNRAFTSRRTRFSYRCTRSQNYRTRIAILQAKPQNPRLRADLQRHDRDVLRLL